MMVMSSQAAHFQTNGGPQRQAAQVPRGRLLSNGNGSGYAAAVEGRRPRSSNPVAPAHSPSPPAMFVRALYNYAADDPTSLSFHQGDVIQVLTQLESGWWDGIVNGQRGWFPSNYCALVPNGDLNGEEHTGSHLEGADDDAEGQEYDEYDDTESDESEGDGHGNRSPQLPLEAPDNDEAAFWLPQVTPDGRLYYFNTLTGASRTELPLETPISSTESGPRLRTEYTAPESTRPPPELMAAGLITDEAANGVDHDDGADNESQGDGEMLMFAETNPHRTSGNSGKASESILNRELFNGAAAYDPNTEKDGEPIFSSKSIETPDGGVL
ncbi:Endophilin-A3 [Dactylellina cionopaga]|nr:Endophilin-A3 [Dactylellina cionopaga]